MILTDRLEYPFTQSFLNYCHFLSYYLLLYVIIHHVLLGCMRMNGTGLTMSSPGRGVLAEHVKYDILGVRIQVH